MKGTKIVRHRKTPSPEPKWAPRLVVGTIAFIAGVTFEVARTNGSLDDLWLLLATAMAAFASGWVADGVIGVMRDGCLLSRQRRRWARENASLRAEIAQLRRNSQDDE